MRRYAAIPAGLILLLSPAAHAANLAVITNPPTIFNLVVLVVAVVGLVGAFRVTDLVRGGLLLKSWQLFVVGFIVLALAQVAALLHAFEFVSIPSLWCRFCWFSWSDCSHTAYTRPTERSVESRFRLT